MAGTNDERALARVFDQAGCFVQRGGASGSGNFRGVEFPGPGDDRAQPDVLAASRHDLFLLELKSGDPPFYFTQEEVDQLKWAARQVAGHALLVVRAKRDPAFRFYDPDHVHTTGSDSRRVKPDADDPLTVLSDPRSKADDPPGYHYRAVAHHGLGRLVRDAVDAAQVGGQGD